MNVTTSEMKPEITELSKETHEVSQGTGPTDAMGVSTSPATKQYAEEAPLVSPVILDRLVDHVNREIGVAQEAPLVMRLDAFEARLAALEAEALKNFGKIKEKTRLLE